MQEFDFKNPKTHPEHGELIYVYWNFRKVKVFGRYDSEYRKVGDISLRCTEMNLVPVDIWGARVKDNRKVFWWRPEEERAGLLHPKELTHA